MKRLTLALVLLPVAALGEPQLLDGRAAAIVQRAIAVMDAPGAHRQCEVVTTIVVKDGKGEVTERHVVDAVETTVGDQESWRTTRHLKDGVALPQKDLDKEDADEKKRAGEHPTKMPFSRRWSGRYSFSWLRADKLWGHDVDVLRVQSRERDEDSFSGTAFIDTATAALLKAEWSPTKLPTGAQFVNVQSQWKLGADGHAVPTLLIVDGAGKLMFWKRAFHSVSEWKSCR